MRLQNRGKHKINNDYETPEYENQTLCLPSHLFGYEFLLKFSFEDDGDDMNEHEDGNGSKDHLREQDIYLPIANVARIMKNAVPQTGKVSLLLVLLTCFVWTVNY